MHGIVLSRRDFREYDQMISLYTKEKGKVEALARGVKKITSKNAAHLEPFCYGMVEIVQGKQIDHLTTVVPIDAFVGIRDSLAKSLAASTVVSVTEKLVEIGEADKKVWQALLSWLKFVDKAKSFPPLLIDGYIVILLFCLGVAPILDHCINCGKSFRDVIWNGQPALYFAGGGLVCDTCRAKKEYVGEQLASVGLREVSTLQLLLAGDWQKIAAFPLEPDEAKRVHALVYQFLCYHSERKIGDWGRLMNTLDV